MLNLIIRQGKEPISWDAFRRTHPRYSIALDGYVAAGSQYDASGPWLNLDHHADVDRLATRATCSQMLFCLRQGMLNVFRHRSGPRATVYVNDCDEDVCLSWFLLKNSHLAHAPDAERLTELVHAVDILDTTAGASLYALEPQLLRELAWVFQPYREARLEGDLDFGSHDVSRFVVSAVVRRIGLHLAGDGDQLPLDARYETVGGGDGWTMVHEIGAQARIAVAADGIDAFVSVRKRAAGNWAYTIGRVSPFVRFDVLAIIERLNQHEPFSQGRWGGGNLIGGSPRRKGSRLSPQKVTRIIDEVVAAESRWRLPIEESAGLAVAP